MKSQQPKANSQKPTANSQQLKSLALQLGFDRIGVARARPLEELRPSYAQFNAEKRYAALDYLHRYTEERLSPERLLPGVQSVIAVAMNYYPAASVAVENNYRIARYARGGSYHVLMKERLNAFADALNPSGNVRSHCFVDSGPVLEKYWAQQCGIGWQGKHTLLIRPGAGSYCFIGIIYTTLELSPDTPETDHCGECRKCIDACPTNALHTPYQLDIGRCISYHTIENRGVIPAGIKENLQDCIYGCDICQEACPHNRLAKPTQEAWFDTIPELLAWRKPDWESLSPETFDRIFSRSDIRRKGWETLHRTIRMCRDNHEQKTRDSVF